MIFARAVRPDAPGVCVRNLATDIEPQTQTWQVARGRISRTAEWFENQFKGVRRESNAAVTNLNETTAGVDPLTIFNDVASWKLEKK